MGPTNPFHGAISFDNIGLAWVAIFLVISLEGWTDVMYFVQDAHSFWNWIYFVCLIVVRLTDVKSYVKHNITHMCLYSPLIYNAMQILENAMRHTTMPPQTIIFLYCQFIFITWHPKIKSLVKYHIS